MKNNICKNCDESLEIAMTIIGKPCIHAGESLYQCPKCKKVVMAYLRRKIKAGKDVEAKIKEAKSFERHWGYFKSSLELYLKLGRKAHPDFVDEFMNGFCEFSANDTKGKAAAPATMKKKIILYGLKLLKTKTSKKR